MLYGAFVWACRALNRPKRRFPARAVMAMQSSTSVLKLMGLKFVNMHGQVRH
jgi:hypothetical protein